MSEENRAILRRVNDEVFSQGNVGLVDELFAPDYVLHDRGIPGGDCVALRTSSNDDLYISHRLPHLQLSVKDQVAEEDKVVTCYSGRSTHQGELMGIPLPVMRLSVDGIITSRVSGGRIEEE